MRLPAAIDSVERFQAMVRAAGIALGFQDHLLLRIELATEELLINIINYAYPPDSNGWIDLTCETGNSGELVIAIRDAGSPFNPLDLSVPDTDAPLNHRDVGGLGVLLIRKIADDIEYQRHGEINLVTLRFRGES